MKSIFRVKSKQDFSKVIDEGKILKNKDFVVYVLKTELGFTRIGVAVTSKIGSAVHRNREKRRLRALIDNLINYQKRSFDMVVIAKLPFKSNLYRENKESLTKLLKEYL